MVKVIKRIAFNIYLCLNMLLCAVVFAPWALPRETISGFLGRLKSNSKGAAKFFAVMASVVPDAIYFWETDHCVEVYRVEEKAREILYP